MNKHYVMGIACGGIFAAIITAVAAIEAIAEGGWVLLASVVFGLAAGLCIGTLIAANFVMLAVEEQHEKAEIGPSEATVKAAA